MKNKLKIVYRVGKRGIKRAAKGKISYKNKGPVKLAYHASKYIAKNGPKAFVKKVKEELVRIDRRIGNNLHFPNGLVSGVEESAILDWYKDNAKPVTVVIPSYNDLKVLIPCLESIKSTTDPSLVKVIVVDDYCEPEHRLKMKKLADEQVTVILRDENGGFAKAVTTGMDAADPNLDIVLVNSDIIAHQGWVEGLQYGAYEFGVDTGIVGPKLLYPDGRIQSAGSYRNTEVPEFFDHYYRFQDENYGPANVPHYCLAVTGACMYIKREFIKYVGGIDAAFQFAFEDVDICLRGWDAGYRTLYFPAATLTHVESASRHLNRTISEKEKQSVKYFWEKWGDWFDKRNVYDEQGRPHVIFVLQSMGMSGGIKIVFEHANALAKRGFNVEVWGIDARDVPWGAHQSTKIRTFKNYERLISALEQEEAIKVATWWETAFPVWLGSVRKGIPVYYIQEFETWFYPNDVVAQSVVVSCYRKEFRNMTTSKFNYDEIRQLGLQAEAIPCGYDNNTYKTLKIKRQNNVLLALGRTFFQKNFQFTFDSWKSLGNKRPDMWLYGIEPNMASLDEKITYHTKPSNKEVNKLFNQATVFVQTSRHEGFSLPILEAMAAGCPVICTDAHGNRDFCFDGKNCLMVDHDDVEGLKAAIDKLFKNKALREKLAKEGLKTVKRYRWVKVMDEVEAFYRKVAKQ